MHKVSSKTIMEQIGVCSFTLTRWHQRGLIPKPTIALSPTGRGKMSWWPAEVLTLCHRIDSLRKGGYRLNTIKHIIDNNLDDMLMNV